MIAEIRQAHGFPYRQFHISFGVEWHGALDVDVLQASLNAIICRHEGLRTRFLPRTEVPDFERRVRLETFWKTGLYQQGLYRQVVQRFASAPVVVHDCAHTSLAQRDVTISAILSRTATEPFSFAAPPLLRVTILRYSDDASLIAIVAHHLVIDLWSQQLFAGELLKEYKSRLLGTPSHLPDVVLHATDYARWQASELTSARYRSKVTFWRDQWVQFANALPRRADFLGKAPSSRPALAREAESAGLVKVEVPEFLNIAARRLAVDANTTVHVCWLSAFLLLLRRYTRRSNVATWMNFSNRALRGSDGTIGWLANSHIVGIDADSVASAREWLALVRRQVLTALDNQEIPNAMVLRLTGAKRPESDVPIFFDAVMTEHEVSEQIGPNVTAKVTLLPSYPDQLRWVRGMHVFVTSQDRQTVLMAIFGRDDFEYCDVERFLADLNQIAAELFESPAKPAPI